MAAGVYNSYIDMEICDRIGMLEQFVCYIITMFSTMQFIGCIFNMINYTNQYK